MIYYGLREPERIIPQVFDMKEDPVCFRIYRNTGMVPNYSGHIPGKLISLGRGEVTSIIIFIC